MPGPKGKKPLNKTVEELKEEKKKLAARRRRARARANT